MGASDVVPGGFSPSFFATSFSAHPWTPPRIYTLNRSSLGSPEASNSLFPPRLLCSKWTHILRAVDFIIEFQRVAVEVFSDDAGFGAANIKEKYLVSFYNIEQVVIVVGAEKLSISGRGRSASVAKILIFPANASSTKFGQTIPHPSLDTLDTTETLGATALVRKRRLQSQTRCEV